MNLITKAWLESAKMDLDLIEHIVDEIHLTSAVSFHAQQAVEKSFKAIFEEKKHSIGKTHNLLKLHEAIKKFANIEIDLAILTTLNDSYIDSRYPGDLGLLPQGKPSLQDAQEFYQFAKDIYKQVEQTLEQTPNKESESQKPADD